MIVFNIIEEHAKNVKKDFNDSNGGIELHNDDGTVVKAHGSSNAKAFYSAIRQAKIAGEQQIVQTMRETVGGTNG